MIIGTAGHIDHGKSSLVEALTGVRMDRLREERERGITIELNFAPFDLGDGRLAGIVDVPGHEDFIRTMVAGASGIDLVLLVIAADEGIKPQTREHLAIAEQLGITRGIPVITKIDLVDREWLSLLELDLTEWLKKSTITFEPPQPVSVVSQVGLTELKTGLRSIAASVPPRNPNDLFRLPVDRVFSVAGIGTVVTGTAWSGQLSPGDQVTVLPSGKIARVRTVQVHGSDVPTAQPGMRVALGLAGLGREEIVRGDTIVAAGAPWDASLAIDVMLTLLPDAPKSLTARSRVRVHLGTSEIIARVFPRASRIEPGSTGMARLALESPGLARGGDPFVIRGFSPVITMGGGRVIDPLPPRRKVTWPDNLAEERIEQRLGALIERRPHGVAAAQLPVLVGASPQSINEILTRSERYVLVEDYWVRREVLDEVGRTGLSNVERFHRARPEERGMPLAQLRQSLRAPAWLSVAVLDQLERGGNLVYRDGVAMLPGHTRRISGGGEQVSRIVSQVRRAGLAPPSTGELTAALGSGDATTALRVAVGDGLLVPVERDRHYAPEALEEFVATLVELGRDGRSITPGQVRDRLAISRKFLIPLLEWADARGITIRTGEGRRLREGLKLPWRIPVP